MHLHFFLVQVHVHIEVGCLGTWGLEAPTPNPGRKNTPKACPTHIPGHEPRLPHPAPAQAPITLNQEFSGEIRTITILLIIIRSEERVEKH